MVRDAAMRSTDLESALTLLRAQGDTQSEPRDATQPDLTNAIHLRESGEYASAAKAILQVIAQHPQNAAALAELARWSIATKDFDAAEICLTLAQERGLPAPSLTKTTIRLHLARRDARAALDLARALCAEDQTDAERYALLGACHRALRHTAPAVEAFSHAISLHPSYAEALLSRGLLVWTTQKTEAALSDMETAFWIKPHLRAIWPPLMEAMGRLRPPKDVIPVLTKILELDPNHLGATQALGACLRATGKPDAAVSVYRKAIAEGHATSELRVGLALALKDQSCVGDALAELLAVLDEDADHAPAFSALGQLLRSSRFSKANPEVEDAILRLLDNDPYVNLKELSPAILSLLQHAFAFETPRTKDALDQTISALAAAPLLLKFIALTPVPDAALETALTGLRAALLRHLDALSDRSEAVAVQSALAHHCYISEYVFEETSDETRALDALAAQLALEIAAGRTPAPRRVFCLASYRPLNAYAWSRDLPPHPALASVVAQQVTEVAEEALFKANTPTLRAIDNAASCAVRAQYEQSPYPRWVIPERYPHPQTLADIVHQSQLSCPTPIPHTTAPQVLIAGCGTGQHALAATSRYAGARILAIDLSLSSLAYAQRKARALGVSKIDFLQADILDLGALGRAFDVIESVGVLHHMADPLAGWQTLRACLQPNGLMKIGLYSQSARRHINTVRHDIAQRGLGASPDDIRALRTEIRNTQTDAADWLRHISDFYALSETRDLLFHVQETQFTLPMIAEALAKLRLAFCGFEAGPLTQHFDASTEGAARNDLQAWHAFETAHPFAFVGMYQFWCQAL